jgi:methyl coenzyme M reductase alpha subunit
MLMHKEGWSRLGFFGYDLQDQCGSARSDADPEFWFHSGRDVVTARRGRTGQW